MAERAKVITSAQFWQALVDAGVLDAERDLNIRRVVIDAQAGHLVMVYVERFGDENLIKAGVFAGLAVSVPDE